MSYQFDIDPRNRTYALLLSVMLGALQDAVAEEQSARGVSQAKIARKLGVSKSLISRRLAGECNVTLKSIADVLWAIDRDPPDTLTFPSRLRDESGRNFDEAPDNVYPIGNSRVPKLKQLGVPDADKFRQFQEKLHAQEDGFSLIPKIMAMV